MGENSEEHDTEEADADVADYPPIISSKHPRSDAPMRSNPYSAYACRLGAADSSSPFMFIQGRGQRD